MKLKPQCRIVKTKDEKGAVTMTRDENRVFVTSNGQTIFDQTFPSNRKAKRYLGSIYRW
jgi:hypothetical protein